MKTTHLLAWMPPLARLVYGGEAQAQVLNRDELRQFGGSYMSDCSKNTSPQVTLLADTVVITHKVRTANAPEQCTSNCK